VRELRSLSLTRHADMSTIAPTPAGLARLLGVILGAGAVALVLVLARPGARASHAPAMVQLSIGASGELDISPPPPRPLLRSGTLVPGGQAAAASFSVRNQTGRTLLVGFRAAADATALDGLLRVRLDEAGAALADTTLQGLRQGGAATRPIAPGATRQLSVTIWIPRDISDGYEGQQALISLLPVVRVEA